MSFWDGTRWVDTTTRPTRSRTPKAGRRPVRDWIATLLMLVGLAVLIVPSDQSQAASPQLVASPNVAELGTVVAITGRGFAAHEYVQLGWDGITEGMPRVRVRGNATFSARLSLDTARAGTHTVTALTSESPTTPRRAGSILTVAASVMVTVVAVAATAAPTALAADGGGTPSATNSLTPSPSVTASPSATATQVAATPVPATPVAATPVPATPVPTPVATPKPTAAPTPTPPPTFTGTRPAMPAGASWTDSFDGSALNSSKWGWDMAMVGTSDNMNRYAMFSTDPRLLEVSNGTLKLKALRNADGSWLQSYISTRGKYTQQYGIFRASMKIPAGHALWPAFWMLDPTRYDEMDVIEAYPEPGNSRYTFCMLNTVGTPCAGIPLPADYSTAFHVYEMEWRPGVAIARLDGVEVARHTIPEMRSQFMLLQMAVGVWFKNVGPDGTTPQNPALEVDWVGTWP